MLDKISKQLNFLAEIDKMKTIYRQTSLIDKSRMETDAEHSWHFAVMAITLFEYCEIDNVNLDRVVKMALVHDLVEIYAGDTFVYDVAGNETKEKREKESADKLFAILPKEQALEFRILWEEFDKVESSDAIYANAIDRFQPFLNNYSGGGPTWIKHGTHSDLVKARMEFVKKVMPKLSDFIDNAIEESIQKGHLK